MERKPLNSDICTFPMLSIKMHFICFSCCQNFEICKMEMNKGEAEKCRELGKKFLRAGNYRQAVKFFEKSLRMYPLPGVDAMCQRAKEELEKGSTSSSPSRHTDSTGPRKREPSRASEEPSRPYTAEQLQIVKKIKACKTHYDVLGVVKNADDSEIKKAYRKVHRVGFYFIWRR